MTLSWVNLQRMLWHSLGLASDSANLTVAPRSPNVEAGCLKSQCHNGTTSAIRQTSVVNVSKLVSSHMMLKTVNSYMSSSD